LILFAGFQAAGTRGASMLAGAPSIKMHGEFVPVRAEVQNLSMLSAHADADEIMRWLSGFRRAPERTFITHGEPEGALALRRRIERELGWTCHIPAHEETVELGSFVERDR
jgi:metallo-beta-lactamase family protein